MKYRIASIIIFMMGAHFSYGQMQVTGTYSLRGVMEIASGLQLKEDSTFQFYFSYGALDRYGSGHWSVKDGYVILNSKPYPGKDFRMIKSFLGQNNFTTIKIEHQNTNLYQLVYCKVKTPEGDSLVNADADGIIVVKNVMDTIHLLCELCPERISSFPVADKKINNYVLNFEPWIAEVYFKSFRLRYDGDHLEGRHPLLDNKEYSFYREK